MNTNDAPEEIDLELLEGILNGHLRYAIAQQNRFLASGGTPPITEDSDHNRFLWVRIKYPAFFRHVAREMDLPKYRKRILGIATAVAASSTKDAATLQDWARAMGSETRHSTIAKEQQRLVGEYLPDVIRVHDDAATPDQRMRTLSTSFEKGLGEHLVQPNVPDFDPYEWKQATPGKFYGMPDWVSVSRTLLCVYPEQLELWVSVARAVHVAVRPLEASTGTRTLTHPVALSTLANHAASICADSWWVDRSASVKQELLETPRIFAYTEDDAKAAATHWLELARLDSRWGVFALFALPRAALGLHRWGAPSQAATLLWEARTISGLTAVQRAALVSDAGYSFRVAGRLEDAQRAYAEALPVVDTAKDRYLRVILRINAAEARGGPSGTADAANLLAEARELAQENPERLASFWWNTSTMFRRLGDELREEAALDALVPLHASLPDKISKNASARLADLRLRNARRRPISPEDALAA